MKRKIVPTLWESEKYYQIAHQGSLDTKHPGMVELFKLAQNAKRILDLGCGDGTRLHLLAKGKQAVGIDASKKAISKAKAKYPSFTFIRANIEEVPLRDESFDLVYLAYVLEHLLKPERVLSEAIRLTVQKGKICLIAPNFGAPNRASPPFKGSRMKKFFRMTHLDFFPGGRKKRLDWGNVKPILAKKYEPDFDTRVEPYLGSLIRFFENSGLTIESYSSCWSQELGSAKLHQKVFKALGNLGIYPFSLWGPHLLLVAQKR